VQEHQLVDCWTCNWEIAGYTASKLLT